MSSLLLYCRPGFESECASEISALAADNGADTRYDPRGGYVLFNPHESMPNQDESTIHLSFSSLVFCRQWFLLCDYLKDLPRGDRIAPLLRSAVATGKSFREFFIETPDSEASKPLQRLCHALQVPLSESLQAAGLLQPDSPGGLRLHVCFFTTDYAALGYVPIDNSAPWPMGIPRLRRLREAPSRSALKLEEALHVLLSKAQQDSLVQAGMTAVDLGAAPGGWSWVMARQGLRVAAVDNGPMADTAMATGLIEHIRADGFRYLPTKPVDWLLCDMVEQPYRIAGLIGAWFVGGHCRHAIFNLKLPMKKRYAEYQRCRELIENMLAQTGQRYVLRARQLYHDRDEITLCITSG